jgi:hypothetical protein
MVNEELGEQLFPALPADERAALGDILDRDLPGGGGRWLYSLVTGKKVAYALTTEP